ncbi:MAG TPA: AMP-binding protein, partial [Acetobacteraceae bacterium]|nr:AMP-binding protein [Acetobacteraceae bacterium]
MGGNVEEYPTWPNLPAMMFGLARTWPDKPMLRAYRDRTWRSITWGEFGRRTASCARWLRAAGVGPGDRVVIVSENRPEYPIAETALMALRAVPVPTYVTNTVADHAHVLRDAGARAAIVSTPALAGALREAGRQSGGLDLLVVMDGPPDDG